MLLGNLGVHGPMLQDESGIVCVMTEAEINSFRNGRGAAHKLEVIPDPPPMPESSTTPILDDESGDEPGASDAAAAEPPQFPKTYSLKGKRVIVSNADAEREAIAAGYKHVSPDPLNAA